MRKKAFTLVELTITIGLTGIIVGALALLYAFAARRSGQAIANSVVSSQLSIVMSEFSRTASLAVACVAAPIGDGTGMKCTMPANCTDKSGAGYPDACTPSSLSRRGNEKWGAGKRIWYYRSDKTGDPTKIGPYLWRAVRSDDLPATASDADLTWTFPFKGVSYRFPLVYGYGFTFDPVNHTVLISVRANSLARDIRQSGDPSTAIGITNVASPTGDASQLSNLSSTRLVFWRHWRR